MFLPLIAWLLFTGTLTTVMILHTRFHLKNPDYVDTKALAEVESKRESRDRRKIDIPTKPNKRKKSRT